MHRRLGLRRNRILGVALLLASTPAEAADFTVREIVEAFAAASAGTHDEFSGRDLSFLDLSGLDFKAANLRGANLYGADLSNANLRGVDLSNALLDRVTIVGTDFSETNLKRAVMRLPHSASRPGFDPSDAPRFAGADLSHARLVVRLDGADLRGANLTGAQLQPYGDGTQNSKAARTSLIGCNLSGAQLAGADLTSAVLSFANLTNADLRGTRLRGADLSRANLSGAKLAAADLTGADLDGSDLRGALGLEQAVGLDMAHNLEHAVR